MSHLYFTQSITDGKAVLCEEDAVHLVKVMRAAEGDEVRLCNGAGMEYQGRLSTVSVNYVEAEILSSALSASEPDREVTLYVGLAKGDKIDFIIQKATELGASRIVPFESRFCVARAKNEDKKAQRWQRIAKEAAKQAARGRIPAVNTPISYKMLLNEVKNYDASFFCYEEGGEPLFANGHLHSRLADAKRIALVTGAEGGFSPDEAQQAKEAGCILTGLGPRILRCETAPIAALTAVMVLTGNL